ADAMNVLYIGLVNPMSISVPGVTPKNTKVTAGPGLKLVDKGNGKYEATVTGGRETSITVSALMPDGTSKRMGEPSKFRIKTVPKPVAQLGGLSSGTYSKSQIASQSILYAYLDGFVFEGVRFTVTKYRAIFVPKRGYMEEASVNSNNASAIRNFANKARPGDIIVSM